MTETMTQEEMYHNIVLLRNKVIDLESRMANMCRIDELERTTNEIRSKQDVMAIAFDTDRWRLHDRTINDIHDRLIKKIIADRESLLTKLWGIEGE